MKKRLDNIWIGIALGALAPALSAFILLKYVYPVDYFDQYLKTIWMNIAAPRILSLAVIPSLALFFFFIQTNRLKSARGILGVTIIYGIIVFILNFTK